MKVTLLLVVGLWLLLSVCPNLPAQPVPHHFSSITVLAHNTVTLSLEGSVSNMFNLSGTISNQFIQMFDLYTVEASTNLMDWAPLALLLRTNNNHVWFFDTYLKGEAPPFPTNPEIYNVQRK
jgi:hypothetical protein